MTNNSNVLYQLSMCNSTQCDIRKITKLNPFYYPPPPPLRCVREKWKINVHLRSISTSFQFIDGLSFFLSVCVCNSRKDFSYFFISFRLAYKWFSFSITFSRSFLCRLQQHHSPYAAQLRQRRYALMPSIFHFCTQERSRKCKDVTNSSTSICKNILLTYNFQLI